MTTPRKGTKLRALYDECKAYSTMGCRYFGLTKGDSVTPAHYRLKQMQMMLKSMVVAIEDGRISESAANWILDSYDHEHFEF